jgi:hypothetical protein
MLPEDKGVGTTTEPTGALAAAAFAAPSTETGEKYITPRPYKMSDSSKAPVMPLTPLTTTKREIYFINDAYLRNPYYDPYLNPGSTLYNYQTVNDDKQLQNTVTDYFLDKTIYWIKHDSSFKKAKKYLKRLEGINGDDIMYKLLKLFVRKGNTNWYDLKIQQDLVKDYIRYKLKSL